MSVSAIKVVPPAPESGRRKPKGLNFGNALSHNCKVDKDTFQYSANNVKIK